MKRKMLLLTLAIPVILCQKAQAQTSSRLVAQSHWSSNGAVLNPNDSTNYTYFSTGRGGDLNHTMKYDQAENWVFLGDTAYANNYYYLQSFDVNNNITSTITQYWNGTIWVNWTNVLYTYDAATNKMLTMTMQSWGGASWVNVSQDAYSYNSAGQLTFDAYGIWNSLTSSFDPTNQRIYFYNTSGSIASEVDQTYNSVSSLYDYTAKYSYTYTGSTTQLLSTVYSTWTGSAWADNYRYVNTYDSTGDMLTMEYDTWSGSAWVNTILHVYSSFNSMMEPGVEIDQTWDATGSGSWVNNTRYAYSYNSWGQMTQSVGESWNVGVGWEFASGDPTAFYYYNDYTPFVESVKTVISNGGYASIYPVPAQSQLHIDLNWTVAQTATISIYDMSGRMVSSINAPMGTEYRGTLSVNSLADGLYVVKIAGTQGQIVKQIVVAH